VGLSHAGHFRRFDQIRGKKMKYQIFIKYKNGQNSYLIHRDRMAWGIRTARKHLKDIVAKRVSGAMFDDVECFALIKA
jgi:hypothetical protein